MQQRLAGDIDPTERAIAAADQVFDEKLSSVGASFQPTDAREARVAVKRLGARFEELPGSIARMIDAARSSGTLFAGDRLQGLAEIIQNADDAAASEVRFLVGQTELLASHDGTPVRLADVHGLATPWLTTKAGDATAIGRFGVGLSTLQSLSPTFEVHCAPYHVRIGDPTVTPVELPNLPAPFSEPGWTTLRVPLEAGTLQLPEFMAWLDRWDDSALLFLRRVDRISLLDEGGGEIRRLAVSRRRDENLLFGSEFAISREFADTGDGRSWAVYSADVPTPSGVSRAHKATGLTTPVAVGLPLEKTEAGRVSAGQVYAGLPVAQMRSPLLVNAQFDPLTSRTDLADNPWNQALLSLVAEVWSEAVLDLFGRAPQAAWQAIPLPCAGAADASSRVIQDLEAAVVDKARQAVASRLSFPVPELGQVSLSRLAVEAQPLEGVLQETEIAELAGLSAALPFNVRDSAGRWRRVLEDWRSHGADLPEPVSVERALDLVGDADRPADSTIALVAAALHEGLDERLLELPCVIARDGRRLVPPAGDTTDAVSSETVPLAERLGIATRLHPAHLASTDGAPEVLEWLRKCGALLDGSDDGAVVRRLAKAGRSGHTVGSPLTDEQVRALRDAFERFDLDTRQILGPDVGRAVRLKSYTYDAAGNKTPGAARPVDAYLPRAIDTDGSLFVAAGKSQGLVWLSGHYAKSLPSQAGRQGVGALKLLRLLGAETAPRLRPHPQLTQRYQSESQRGLFQQIEGGPEARSSAMKERGATYTLEDRDSPDLLAVVTDISREPRSKQRRKRASALLAALSRAWDRRLGDFAEVDGAASYYGWELRGKFPAFWLAQAGDIAWLDDESRTACKPTELRVRTPGTEAIYGPASPNYLHADLDQTRRPVLTALGVLSDPSRSQLVERLRELQHASHDDDYPPGDLRRDTALVYRALARTLSRAPAESDLTDNQLFDHFARHRLMHTNLGWLSPRRVLAGPPIFGDLHPFAPAIAECEPLWRVLRLRPPSPEDCLEVLRHVARRRKHEPDETEEAVLLETLRMLAEHYSRGKTVERKKLAKLALWTTKGWTRERPVYATDDPDIAAGLGDRLPIWQPGGGLDRFRSLLEPLRVSEIRASEAEVVSPEHAQEAPASTALFKAALELLRDDLQRNAPDLTDGLKVPWVSLTEYTVKVHPSLALSVKVASGQEHHCEVKAKVDTTRGAIFVTQEEQLPRVDGGGRALAALFEGKERPVAHAWRAACDQAEEGIRARVIELAQERSEREKAELDADSRLAEFREGIAQKERSPRGAAARAAGKAPASRAEGDGHGQPSPAAAPRTLVDPESLMLVDPRGRMHQGSPSAEDATSDRATRNESLNEPTDTSRAPQNRTALRGYSDLDKETAGLELLQKLLDTDPEGIVDLRTQRGVGADAVDDLKNYYELKVFAGPEPNEVTLTDSEAQRAITDPQFFLIVISNIEGADARPNIRVVNNPLNNLQPTERGTITLSGLRDATSLIYDFAPINDQPASMSEVL